MWDINGIMLQNLKLTSALNLALANYPEETAKEYHGKYNTIFMQLT